MLKRNLAVAGVSLAMVVWTSMASLPATAAIVPAVSVSGGTLSTPVTGTEQGWEFETTSGITVNYLGVFDPTPDDDLTDSHVVSLWDASDSSLIASAIVRPASTFSEGFRYVPITPVTLASGGTFVISALYPSDADKVLLFLAGMMGITPIFEITVTDGRVGTSAGFPPPDVLFGFERFGPNFSVDPLAPVPLPAALPLFLSALAGLGFFGWRRRIKAGA